MSDPHLEATIRRVLGDIAPDIAPDEIDPDQPFRDQFDFDSMDHLNFAIGLHEATGVDIPEADYPSLSGLSACVRYLQEKLPARR